MTLKWGVTGSVVGAFVVLAMVVFGGSAPVPSAEASSDLAATGSLNVVVKPGEMLRACPLEHTEVEGWVTGDVAHVQVTQRFGNPYADPIEAVYVFPLPENAAVNEMEMRIGTRVIRGVVKPRGEAREIYEEAKTAGKTASLLEQERPNVFTQSVANILPGEAVEITIWYVQDLHYDRGRYEFTFPMVVGPRYIPGAPLPPPDSGGGWAHDTDQVPDASRITPPVLRPEERTGHDIALTLNLEAAVPVYDLVCTSHDIEVGSVGGEPTAVRLAAHDRLPNKDFSLSWRVAGERPEVGVLAHTDDRSGYFMLVLQPKAEFEPEEITPKEMIFCLDTSGSMTGLPIEKSKEVVTRCLQEMGPEDTFQVIRFASDSSTFAPAPVRATKENAAKATEFVEAMQGAGGTEMLQGIEESLALPADPRRLRIVAFLTDGYIGNESEILTRIQEKLGTARVFSFGVGSSVNRYLLRKMAEMGRGFPQFVRQDEDPEEAVRTFIGRISRPYLTDVEIDWGSLAIADTYPSYVPDLFADQPVILHGRYDRPGSDTVRIRGLMAGQPWETTVSVRLPEKQQENEALAVLWARASIEDMMDQMHGDENDDLVASVTDLGIAYSLVTRYTSFVAVEEKIVNRDGKQVTVEVPVPMPEGVSYEGVFGEGEVALRGVGGGMRGGGGGRAGGGSFMGGARGGGGLAVRAKGARLGMPPAAMAPARLELDSLSGAYGLPKAWIAIAAAEEDWEAAGAALANIVTAARASIGVPPGSLSVLTYDDLGLLEQATDLRILILSGSERVTLSEEARKALGAYMRAGGFVIVDSGEDDFYASIVPALVPDGVSGLRPIPPSHAVFRGASMPYSLSNGLPPGAGGGSARPAEGRVSGRRLQVFVSREDLTRTWAAPSDGSTLDSCQLGVNLIAYALQTGD